MNGVTAPAADYALGGAILSALPPWTVPVTSDINFTFLRPVRVDAERLIAHGQLIDAGRTQATSEGRIDDANGPSWRTPPRGASSTPSIRRW